MTVSVTHQKVSAIADDPASVAAGEVVPSDWNATHTFNMASGFLLGRSTSGTGAAEEITVGSGLSLTGGTLAASTGVTTFSAGSTGFTPNSATSGAITLAGTLAVSNGGTGVTTSTGTGSVVLSDSPTLVTPALGTPSSGVVTNLTGTASININGTVGATTPSTGAFTTLSASSTVSGTGFSTYLASPPAIGGTVAAAGSFTNLSATGISVFGGGIASANAGSEITIVGTAPTDGGTNANGMILTIAAPSNVTNQYFGIRNAPGTAASSFTVGTLACYAASAGTIGSGSAVTNLYGYFAQTGLTAGSNNYGFYGNIAASGSARWNLYMGGTAPNFMQGPLGIGGTTTIDTFRISGTASGATTFNGEVLDQTIGSGITANYRSILSRPIMQNAVFTLTNLYHFYANPQSKPASPTITNQYGYHAESTLTDATNNFGFYSNIASAANRWNFYANGTAANYFAGSTYIAGTTGDQALNVNGSVRVAAITTVAQSNCGTFDFTSGNTRFFSWGGTGTAGNIAWWTSEAAGTNATQRMTLLGAGGNLGLGTTTFGTSATITFSIASGTAPTTGVADTVQYYSSDLSAGNTIPSWYTEGTNVGTGTPTANRTIAVRFNGTVYYLLASTTA